MAYHSFQWCGGDRLALRHPHAVDNVQNSEHSECSVFWTKYCISDVIIVFFNWEHQFPNPHGRKIKMSAVDELIKYILELTPEQVDKVVNQLPRLTELLSKSSQPCPQEQFSQTRSA